MKTKLPIHAIDVNSKFETAPGNKNIELLKKFKRKLMNYNVDERGYYGDFGGLLSQRCYTQISQS